MYIYKYHMRPMVNGTLFFFLSFPQPLLAQFPRFIPCMYCTVHIYSTLLYSTLLCRVSLVKVARALLDAIWRLSGSARRFV